MLKTTSEYDKHFQAASLEFFGPDFDWKWIKAQAIAESSLDPTAVSRCGAMGIMQLMPGTFSDMARKTKHSGSISTAPFNPVTSIRIGVAYDRQCWEIWKKESGIERLRFMFASYNAGAGNIIKAQRLATDPTKWASVAVHLHKITGQDNAMETINYIHKIERLHGSI